MSLLVCELFSASGFVMVRIRVIKNCDTVCDIIWPCVSTSEKPRLTSVRVFYVQQVRKENFYDMNKFFTGNWWS